MTQDDATELESPEQTSDRGHDVSLEAELVAPEIDDACARNGAGDDAARANGIPKQEGAPRGESVRPLKGQLGASPTALQDMFLNGLRRENIDVVVYMCDGAQERGAVRGFDTFTILLENRNSGKSQLIYKHAVARIFPTRCPSMPSGPERPKK